MVTSNMFYKNKLSILIPSRKRTNYLIDSINSILENTENKNNIEILLRMDNDDLDSVEIIKNHYKEILNTTIRIFVGDRYRGYFDLPVYYYELSQIATGEWLFVYNDDLFMITSNYDSIFQNLNTEKKILYTDRPQGNCSGTSFGGNWCFPIIHRDIIEILGHFTVETPYTDGWIKTIAEELNLGEVVPISLEHSEEILNTMDEVNQEKNEINKTVGTTFNWHHHINHNDGLIRKDINKLKQILNL
jgi:hypothetical protein